MVDLGHEFTFYADGRFHQQYLPNQPVAMNWGALYRFDFANANLLVLLGCDAHLRYVEQDVQCICAFLHDGGGVVMLGSHADKSQNELAQRFGCSVVEKTARAPLVAPSRMISRLLPGQTPPGPPGPDLTV